MVGRLGWAALAIAAAAGCSETVQGLEPEPVDTGHEDGAANEANTADAGGGQGAAALHGCDTLLPVAIAVQGQVVDSDGHPLYFADVWLESRWDGEIAVYGGGRTDAGGVFAFTAVDVPMTGGCAPPAFHVVANWQSGALIADADADAAVTRAWTDGTFRADLSSPPVVATP